MRKSELLLAQWPHVDFDAGEWHIPEQNSKTGKPHIVYLSRQAAELFSELKALAGISDWVEALCPQRAEQGVEWREHPH